MSGRARLAPLLATLALAACQGSDPQPLTFVSADGFAGAESLVDGGGADSTFGYTAAAAGAAPTLRLVRHDAAAPDLLTPLGDVGLGDGGRITRLRVTDEAAALVVRGEVWLVDPADPSLLPARISAPDTTEDLAVSGRWVAVASSHSLFLVSRDAPGSPAAFAATSTPTGLVATRTGFLAFTTTGYLVADTTGPSPTVVEVGDPVLRDLREGRAGAGRDSAVLAGPGRAADRSRVLRLDLADPAAPVVLRGLELPGAFVALAWDGGGTAVLAVHGDGDDDARPSSFHQGWLLRETAAGFEAAGLPLAFWSLSDQPLAAHAGRLLAAEGGGATLLGIR